MGRQKQQQFVEEDEEQEPPQVVHHQKRSSLRSKAVHFVSDLTTGLLNPISDKPSKQSHNHPPSSSEEVTKSEGSKTKSSSEKDSGESSDGPDTSSFTAFLYSLLSTSEPGSNSNSPRQNEIREHMKDEPPVPILTNSGRKKSLFSRGKQSLGKAIGHAAKLGGLRNQSSVKSSSDSTIDDKSNKKAGNGEGVSKQNLNEPSTVDNLPETSEQSLLLSEKTRGVLYSSLPALVQGRKWVLLYSTWRHGISLSNLYRRSNLWPGLSLLVVGDRKGAVFGGLVEAPLIPTTQRRYQGTSSTFVFSNVSGHPVIFRPTGANRYFTLCSKEYLAMGGGNHFALYLDGDLLSGSSSASDTYGNSCLSHTDDFDVKEIELWGFVYASKYEEILSSLQTEPSGICRWQVLIW